MTLKTVAVNVSAAQSGGTIPLTATVTFTMTGADIDVHTGDLVVPDTTTLHLDANGDGVAHKWPNARGNQGTQYLVVIESPEGSYRISKHVTVPDNDCDLYTLFDFSSTPNPSGLPTLAQLASPSGSSLVGFSHSQTYAAGTIGAHAKQFVSVTDAPYNAKGDGSTDDTSAVQSAFNSGKSVILPDGYVFGITSQLSVSANNVTITGGGTIKPLASYDVSGGTLSALAVTGENVTIDAVTFDGSAAPSGATNNRFVWCTAPRLNVTSKASFLSLPSGGSNFNGAIGCSSLAPYARVNGAYFYSNPGAVFFQGRNCVANGNVIVDPRDVAIAFNGTGAARCVAVGNSIYNGSLNSCSSLIAAEEGASLWTIEGNNLYGVKDGAGISALNVAVTTQVRGGKIVGNIVDGGSGVTTNPAALISSSIYYDDVEISGNTVCGMPTGNSNSRLIIAASTGGSVSDNIIDGASATGLSAIVTINSGARGITIKDNTSWAAAGGRHFLFGAGDYSNVACQFIGGKFYGGAEGINSELNSGTMTNFWLYITNITDSSATNIVNSATALGDRAAWLNAGAWARPHWISVCTDMYGSGAPVSGTFYDGDVVRYLAPTFPGGYAGVIRAGGAWRSFGALA